LSDDSQRVLIAMKQSR